MGNSLSCQLDKQPRFKQVLFGDFNAVIGSDSTGRWGSACGSNSPNLRKTSANGLRLLKFCQHRGLMLANTWKRCRRRHRGTHFLQLTKSWRRLDYVALPKLLFKLVRSCRAHTGLSLARGRLKHANFTDHNIVICTLAVPQRWKWRQIASRKPRKKVVRYDVSQIRLGTMETAEFSERL